MSTWRWDEGEAANFALALESEIRDTTRWHSLGKCMTSAGADEAMRVLGSARPECDFSKRKSMSAVKYGGDEYIVWARTRGQR